MKSLIVLCILSVAVMALARPNDSLYTDRYDNINVQEILDNRNVLVPYMKCALDQGKCTPEGKELKGHIKEALETYCEKCTDIQKTETKRVIKHLINKEPEYWKQLCDKFDPQGTYVSKYEKELKEIQA